MIVDAGLRSPSEGVRGDGDGCEAVLVNSAVAVARDPAAMALAFAKAVEAGFEARNAGLMPRSGSAVATSPLTSFLGATR